MHLNFKEIAGAWYNKFKHTDAQKELADARFDICLQCDSKKEIIKKAEWSLVCGECGCPLKAKIYTDQTYADVVNGGSCPLNKWEEIEKAWHIKYPEKAPKPQKINKSLL